MRIGIVGAGGIGGYLAVRLARAGHPVALIARGDQLAAIQRDGLRLVQPDGEEVLRPDKLSDEPQILSDVELAVFATKAHQLPAAIAATKDVLPNTALTLPFQNGVASPDLLAQAFGRERALIGVARILANITAPGVITRYGDMVNFTVGALDGSQTGRAGEVIETFTQAGIPMAAHPDVRVDLWTKFVSFNALSSVSAASRASFGQIRETPEALALLETLMEETAALGRAAGVPLVPDIAKRIMMIASQLPAEGRTSTAHDLAVGRPLEIDWLCGAAVRMGQDLRVPTPASAVILGLLAPWRDGSATLRRHCK